MARTMINGDEPSSVRFDTEAEAEAETVTVSSPVVSDGNDEFPIPFERFAQTLHHTENEVWVTLLRIEHGRENHTPTAWHSLLDSHRVRPAHPGP